MRDLIKTIDCKTLTIFTTTICKITLFLNVLTINVLSADNHILEALRTVISSSKKLENSKLKNLFAPNVHL